VERGRDQCRKNGCPGCRDCLDWENPEHKVIIIYNDLKRVENRMKVLRDELSFLEKEYFSKRALLNDNR